MKTIGHNELLDLISRSSKEGAGVAFAIDSYSNVYVVPRDNLNASYVPAFDQLLRLEHRRRESRGQG